ncbi:MAG TPA: response regulator transcription factor [Chloroflexota bacterium]|nr:response regulator transcription factor [Chloroflexota bacterium]
MNGRSVLVIEAEAASRRLLHALLNRSGYRVTLAVTGHEGLEQVAMMSPELMVLSLTLPDMPGLELCRELREWTDVPIIMVSDDATERTKVNALDLGADDYVTKPFGQEEFLARVRAVLRRARRDPPASTLEIGHVRVDQTTRRVTVAGREVHLTPTEYEILKYLMINAGKVVTYSTLLRTVWGEAYAEASPTLRVFIAQLRRKIEPDPDRPANILTEPRVGYRFRLNE